MLLELVVGHKGKVVYVRCGRHIKEVEVCLHSFLTSLVDGGEWSTSRLGRFTPGKESWNPFIMRLGVDLRVGVGCFGEEKKSLVPAKI